MSLGFKADVKHKEAALILLYFVLVVAFALIIEWSLYLIHWSSPIICEVNVLLLLALLNFFSFFLIAATHVLSFCLSWHCLFSLRLKALVAIPKVQPRFAIAIWKKYPTMKSLLQIYMDPSKSVSIMCFLS